jgi:hypothetical protein
MAGKSGKLGGLALGLAVVTVYYVILIYGENLVRAGKIAHTTLVHGLQLLFSDYLHCGYSKRKI